jgi:hypothetical protein
VEVLPEKVVNIMIRVYLSDEICLIEAGRQPFGGMSAAVLAFSMLKTVIKS